MFLENLGKVIDFELVYCVLFWSKGCGVIIFYGCLVLWEEVWIIFVLNYFYKVIYKEKRLKIVIVLVFRVKGKFFYCVIW